jgi:hypothetical protein
MFWQLLVPGTQTVTVTNATLVEVYPRLDGPASTTIGAELPLAEEGLTATVAVPATPLFCAEVAVTVSTMLVVTVGAVSNPEEEMLPALALQLTAVLKFPVPVTVAVHWLVPPEVIELGEQLTPTETTLELPPPPLPPHAAKPIMLATASNSPNLRIITTCLLQRIALV